MWRSDCESRILKTYVPAGSIPQPWRWTPGISTGPLKVKTVFRFVSSALALGENPTPRTAMPNSTVGAALKNFIGFPLVTLDSVRSRFAGLAPGLGHAGVHWALAAALPIF